MNKIQQQRQTLRHFGTEGVVVLVPLGRDQTRSITVARDGTGIHRIDGAYLSWTREESIDAAKAILEYHNVPFCNRVPGAGLEK